uniref:Uncharacterized protein n=1 Tax=Zea mays TaxID=4577 RepID=A0A804QFN4_MAIZE
SRVAPAAPPSQLTPATRAATALPAGPIAPLPRSSRLLVLLAIRHEEELDKLLAGVLSCLPPLSCSPRPARATLRRRPASRARPPPLGCSLRLACAYLRRRPPVCAGSQCWTLASSYRRLPHQPAPNP